MSRTISIVVLCTLAVLSSVALTFADPGSDVITPTQAARSIAEADPTAVASQAPSVVEGRHVDPSLTSTRDALIQAARL